MDLKIIEFLFVLKRCAEYKCYLKSQGDKDFEDEQFAREFCVERSESLKKRPVS